MDPDLFQGIVATAFDGTTIVLFQAELVGIEPSGVIQETIHIWAEDKQEAVALARRYFAPKLKWACSIFVGQMKKY